MARVMVDFMNSADLPVGNANRTIELWAFVKTSSWVGDANTMFFYGTNNRVADGFGLDFGAVVGTIDPFTNAIFDNDNQPSGLGTSSDQWAHFAMTWDGTTVRAFVNGVEKASQGLDGRAEDADDGPHALTIGGYAPAFFNGYIDEFRVWNVCPIGGRHHPHDAHDAGRQRGWTGRLLEVRRDQRHQRRRLHVHRRPPPHPGVLMASGAANLPVFVVSTAPISCSP